MISITIELVISQEKRYHKIFLKNFSKICNKIAVKYVMYYMGKFFREKAIECVTYGLTFKKENENLLNFLFTGSKNCDILIYVISVYFGMRR